MSSFKTFASFVSRQRFVTSLSTSVCLYLLSGCVAQKPLDNVACPCAPGWTCVSATNVCVKSDSLGSGGAGSGGGVGGAAGMAVDSGLLPDADVAPCDPLVVPANTAPGDIVAGCPCTRRPGAGNSFLCPVGANDTVSQTIGPEGGRLGLLGRQSGNTNIPFELNIPPGALDHPTLVTVTETNLPPPFGFVDYSPIYHLEPDSLVLDQIATLQIPWGSSLTGVPVDLGVYQNLIPSTCGFNRIGDSYANAGFEMSSLTHGGYLFVGAPKTAAQASCP